MALYFHARSRLITKNNVYFACNSFSLFCELDALWCSWSLFVRLRESSMEKQIDRSAHLLKVIASELIVFSCENKTRDFDPFRMSKWPTVNFRCLGDDNSWSPTVLHVSRFLSIFFVYSLYYYWETMPALVGFCWAIDVIQLTELGILVALFPLNRPNSRYDKFVASLGWRTPHILAYQKFLNKKKRNAEDLLVSRCFRLLQSSIYCMLL
jgi:hypothetical protein